jgi:hypothetical protein
MSTDLISGQTRKIGLLACWVAGAIAAFYVLARHRVHLVEWLPYLVLLACPIMHVLMHGRHGHDKHEPRQ